MRNHIDHIDPKWKEGRDYQLVCGLDVVYNMCERDRSLNIRKSNRFVPWRWCKDAVGAVPVEPGDLCLFLTYDTKEWVLEEFLGTWWYEQSRLWGYFNTQPNSEETKRKRVKAITGREVTEETRRRISETLTGCTHSEETRRKMSEANRRRKGEKRSEETRRKISEAGKRRWARARCRSMSLSDPQMPDFED